VVWDLELSHPFASLRGTLRPARAKPYPFPSRRPTMPQSASGDRQQREALFASRDGECFQYPEARPRVFHKEML